MCHLEETVCWVGDSSLGQLQLWQNTANISPSFRWGQERAWIHLSCNPTPILAVCMCSVPKACPSPLDNHGRLGDTWAVMGGVMPGGI